MDALLGLSVPLTIVLWGRWYYSLRLGRTLLLSRRGRMSLALVPVFCIIFLLVVLRRWSANNVKSDLSTVVLYLTFGASWLGLTQLLFGLLGVSARDDVLERGNPAAAWVICGQLIGTTFCFAGANIGNGPGPEAVFFCALLSTTAFFLFWFLMDRVASVCDSITIDRHPGTGIRLCGCLVANGIVLGDAVTGEWKSASATVRDLAAYAWPAGVFALLTAVFERKMRTLEPNARRSDARRSMVLAAAYVVCAAGYAWERGIH